MSIRAKNITFKYFENSKTNVIENLDFTIPEKQITILAGKSGSGKSTLAYILAGLYPENGGFLTSGEVYYDDVDILALTPDKRVRYVSMMFQNPDLQFCMNNLENEIRFCLENIGVPENEMDGVIYDAVDKINIRYLLYRNFNAMSGGEKQKCALCCILALKSECIILDEAFAKIDTQSTRDIINIIKLLNITVLAIDHNIEIWKDVYDNIRSLDGTMPKTIDFQANLHQPGNVILSTHRLTVNGISYPEMKFAKGSLTAVLGKSGCGKTTFF